MAEEFKIVNVKSQAKDWESKFGPMKTYLVQLEGNGEPVQLNKKADSPAPKIGDEVYGDVQETEYGQKFKSVAKPFASKPSFQPREDHHEEIKAQWAIGQAVQLAISGDKSMPPEWIEATAKVMFSMVDRVKGGSESTNVTSGYTYEGKSENAPTGYEKFKASKPKSEDDFAHSMASALDGGTEINLDDIPF